MAEEKIYGLLGRKLGHSWSAPIHQELGCDSYRLIELEPEELESFLRQPGIGGLNVTIPYKKAVMAFCDVIDDTARAIGSVNTIVGRYGKLYGYNTDAAGFIWMAERAGISFEGKKVVILGSGGASVTAQTMTRLGGARQVVVISRSGEDNYENLSRHDDADIVVNTTPVGMYPHTGEAPVDLRAFPRCSGVLDVVYNPRRTALILQAEELGIPCSDGLPMLVRQAVAAEEHFFSRTIPDSENERILGKLRQEMTNIVLIGMPGSGKSSVGARLAELTGREAVDLDKLIVQKAGMSIPEIFAAQGEAAFRALEREVTTEAGKLSGKILLTGGGVVKDERNYAPLRQNGRIYHLLRDLELLPTEGRPLSQTTKLTAMWEERRPMYERFRDAVIDNDGAIEDTAQTIWRDFCENSGS
ncbi:MAG: shikimate kinase [Ruminococcaceae bacterium]|nr:shikimate kinase [Oscillospiraceae bacterium]